MAEHMIETRILLRYDTFSNWMNSNTILMQGEIAVAVFPLANTLNRTDHIPVNTPPAVGIKVGDGRHYFDELPWLQGIAADVYSWAKSSTKPTYSASEIIGLANYIEQYSSSSTGINASAYRIIYNSSTEKYILQYQDVTTQEWIDTTGEIDFSAINLRVSHLENWANGSTSSSAIGTLEPLVLTIRDELFTQLNKINYNDIEEPNQFVTAVSQSNGKISVSRAALKASDIASGILNVSQGGTGATSFTRGYALIGNDTSAITTKEIVSTIYSDSTNALPTAGAVVRYVDNATAGLSGAMHYIGDATVTITPNSGVNPQIDGYNFSKAQPGDVVLYDAKEFVWTGSYWRLLGDEGSYAVKGSITDADIAEEAAISQSKIDGLIAALANKVNIEVGKGLSSNDYTSEEKYKLGNIEEEAQRNIIEHIYVNGTEVLPSIIENNPNSVGFRVSALTPEEEEKIGGIEAGAQVNKIEHIFLNSTELNIGTIKDLPKSVNIVLNEFTDAEKNKLADIEALAQVNRIESIVINDVAYQPDANKSVNITIDEAALNLEVIKGARVPKGGLYEDVDITQDKKLELSRIAKTGNIDDIVQTPYTYVILDCGSSTEVL